MIYKLLSSKEPKITKIYCHISLTHAHTFIIYKKYFILMSYIIIELTI